jgi:ATP-dependent DNA ligase
MTLLHELSGRKAKFIEPCLPRAAEQPPAGRNWIHEIKHDGFRIMAKLDPKGVRLLTRNGNDFAGRFPLAASAIAALPVETCLIDSEAIVCDPNGLALFDLLRDWRHNDVAVLCAFDLIELEGHDLRRTPIEARKRMLSDLLRRSHPGITLNKHFGGDGNVIFEHAYALGCEGIVSKRLGSPYLSGRSDYLVKVKNPNAPAVRREAEEEWGAIVAPLALMCWPVQKNGGNDQDGYAGGDESVLDRRDRRRLVFPEGSELPHLPDCNGQL